jgi:transposase
LRQVNKRSPSYSCSSLADATSSPTAKQDHHPPKRGATVFVSGFGTSFGSELRRSPHPPDPLPQTPAQLRRAGHKRVATYLRNRGVKGSNKVAQKALSAAKAQRVTLPAQEVASRIVAELAEDVLGLKERINSLDEELKQRFFARPEARILTSLPGMGPILRAELLVAVGDISAFESAGRLAAYAGLVPAARDSGKRVGNHRRMRGGNKTLKRVFYQSAFASLRGCAESRAFYERKRSEGKRHTQAL